MTHPDPFVRSAFERAQRNREGTAFHEAGHVAAAWRLGVGIRGRVTIAPDLTCWGSAAVGKRISDATFFEVLSRASLGLEIRPRARSDLEAQIIVLNAGRLAHGRAIRDGEAVVEPIPTDPVEREWLPGVLLMERLAVNTARDAAGLPRARSDDEQAWALLMTLSAGRVEEANAYGGWLWERTRWLVDGEPFWTITRAAAKALLRHETLSATATRKVARDALRPEISPEFSSYVLEPPSGRRP